MYEISGQILDTNEFAVENATVSVAGTGKYALTDERGNFCIHNVPPGSFFLIAEHRDYNQYVTPIMVTQDKTVFITMTIDQGIMATS